MILFSLSCFVSSNSIFSSYDSLIENTSGSMSDVDIVQVFYLTDAFVSVKLLAMLDLLLDEFRCTINFFH